MSEQENNICAVCGGIKRFEYTIGFEEGVLLDVRVGPREVLESGRRLCPGHPVPDSDQDIIYGDLGDHAAAWHDESWGYDQIAIRAKGEVRIDLRPQQFLRLLEWGATHRAAIEQLTKE